MIKIFYSWVFLEINITSIDMGTNKSRSNEREVHAPACMQYVECTVRVLALHRDTDGCAKQKGLRLVVEEMVQPHDR